MAGAIWHMNLISKTAHWFPYHAHHWKMTYFGAVILDRSFKAKCTTTTSCPKTGCLPLTVQQFETAMSSITPENEVLLTNKNVSWELCKTWKFRIDTVWQTTKCRNDFPCVFRCAANTSKEQRTLVLRPQSEGILFRRQASSETESIYFCFVRSNFLRKIVWDKIGLDKQKARWNNIFRVWRYHGIYMFIQCQPSKWPFLPYFFKCTSISTFCHCSYIYPMSYTTVSF